MITMPFIPVFLSMAGATTIRLLHDGAQIQLELSLPGRVRSIIEQARTIQVLRLTSFNIIDLVSCDSVVKSLPALPIVPKRVPREKALAHPPFALGNDREASTQVLKVHVVEMMTTIQNRLADK